MSSNKSLILLSERQFPLCRDFHLDISDVSFSHGASPGVIKTSVTSNLVPLKLFCENFDHSHTPRVKENGKDNILFRWHHAPANHVDWVEAVTGKLLQPVIHSSFVKFWSSNEQSNRRGSKNVLFMRPTSEVFYTEVCRGMYLISPRLEYVTLRTLVRKFFGTPWWTRSSYRKNSSLPPFAKQLIVNRCLILIGQLWTYC